MIMGTDYANLAPLLIIATAPRRCSLPYLARAPKG
jgi:hypothetical protein